MKPSKFKFLFVLILAVLLFSFFGSFALAAERELETKYPKIPGAPILRATSTIPEYVIYFFNLSLIIGVVIASVVIIYGGIRYIFSAGKPEVLKEAKSRIFSAILGLAILFSSYLILTTISPQFLSPKEPKIGPSTGIYLINAENEKKYIPESENKIYFDATSIEFISSSTELYSVFVSPKEEFDGENSKEIKNPGTGNTSDDPAISSLKSIYFLWNRAGVYLYAKENFGTPPPPRFFQSSVLNLGDFDNRTKSIRIKDTKGQLLYLAFLFSEPSFEGKEGIGAAIENNYSLNYVLNDVSSIDVSRVTSTIDAITEEGEVIFYEDIDCSKKKNSFSAKAGSPSTGGVSIPIPWLLNYSKAVDFNAPYSLDWEVLSFEIKGNYWVMFNTKKDLQGRTEIFRKEGCYPTLKGTYVYHPHPEKWKPRIAMVFYSPR